jgi:arylamine N-acetyltransferase
MTQLLRRLVSVLCLLMISGCTAINNWAFGVQERNMCFPLSMGSTIGCPLEVVMTPFAIVALPLTLAIGHDTHEAEVREHYAQAAYQQRQAQQHAEAKAAEEQRQKYEARRDEQRQKDAEVQAAAAVRQGQWDQSHPCHHVCNLHHESCTDNCIESSEPSTYARKGCLAECTAGEVECSGRCGGRP